MGFATRVSRYVLTPLGSSAAEHKVLEATDRGAWGLLIRCGLCSVAVQLFECVRNLFYWRCPTTSQPLHRVDLQTHKQDKQHRRRTSISKYLERNCEFSDHTAPCMAGQRLSPSSFPPILPSAFHLLSLGPPFPPARLRLTMGGQISYTGRTKIPFLTVLLPPFACSLGSCRVQTARGGEGKERQ